MSDLEQKKREPSTSKAPTNKKKKIQNSVRFKVRVEGIALFLEKFYELTCIFSGTKYPTANLYFPKVFLAYLTLLENCGNHDEYLKKMAVLMLEKFEKYWSNFNITMAIAVTLDPRYKFLFVEFAYKKLFKKDASDKIERIRNMLYALYDYYELNASSTQFRREIQSSAGNSEQVQQKEHDAMAEFDETGRIDDLVRNKSQLEQYLEDPRKDRNVDLDVLEFWYREECRYPIVAAMARDLLSIPITTVASESAFSAGGRVVDEVRNSLVPETVEALICCKDWIRADLLHLGQAHPVSDDNFLTLRMEDFQPPKKDT